MGCLQAQNCREYVCRAHWAVIIYFCVTFQLVPVSGHSAWSSSSQNFKSKFQIFSYVVGSGFYIFGINFFSPCFNCCLYFRGKKQLIPVRSKISFGKAFCVPFLFCSLAVDVKPHITVIQLIISCFNCGMQKSLSCFLLVVRSCEIMSHQQGIKVHRWGTGETIQL